jgi:hypothetical protein
LRMRRGCRDDWTCTFSRSLISRPQGQTS